MINVILVNYHSREQVMASVLRLNHHAFFFVIVDNSDELQESDFVPYNSVLLKAPENLGYAGGNNLAFKFLRDRNISGNVFILNPDVTISAESILRMNAHIEQDVDAVGQVFCSAIDEYGAPLYGSIKMNGFFQTWNQPVTGVEVSDYAAGSAMMINRLAVNDYIFDEDFFLYWEEVELSLRIRKKGFTILVDNDIVCVRESNVTERVFKSLYYLVRNSFLLRRKVSSLTYLQHCLYLIKMLASCVVMGVKKRSFLPVKFYFMGFCSGVLGRSGALG